MRRAAGSEAAQQNRIGQWKSDRAANAAPAAAPAPAPTKKRGLTWRDADVMHNVNRIISEGSPLMRAAQTTGLQLGASRGLLNSSMAVGAAQDEMIKAATPLALQNAAQNAARLTQMADIKADSRERRKDRGLQTRLAKWNLNAADREKVTAAMGNYLSNFETALANINANENLSAEQRTAQVEALTRRRDKWIGFMETTYDVDIGYPTAFAPRADGHASRGAGKGGGRKKRDSGGGGSGSPQVGATRRTADGKTVRWNGSNWVVQK
jgi:hypothetical protein